MIRTVVLVIGLGILFHSSTLGQIKVSNNSKLFFVENSESEPSESANSTVRDFFDLAQQGKRAAWEALIAGTCFAEGKPKEYVNRWYNQLAITKVTFDIIEILSPKTDQKIIHYTTSGEPDIKKTIVLIREKERWKIYQADI